MLDLNVCLNARNTINKKCELNIMVEDIDPHITGITKSPANKGISDAELRLTGYVLFRARGEGEAGEGRWEGQGEAGEGRKEC